MENLKSQNWQINSRVLGSMTRPCLFDFFEQRFDRNMVQYFWNC